MTADQIRLLHALAASRLKYGDPARAMALAAVAFEASPRDFGLFEVLIGCYLALGHGAPALRLLDEMPGGEAPPDTRQRLQVLRAKALWLVGRQGEAQAVRLGSLQPAGGATA